MDKSAYVILAPDFEEVEAITPIDLLRRAGIKVHVIGLDAKEIKGSHDVTVVVDAILTPTSSLPDAIVLPGGPGHRNLLKSELLIEFVKKMFAAGRLCAAICAAPSVFGKAGILAGKKATCFPGYEDKLNGGLFVNQQVVVDGTVITSRSAGTAIPFSLGLIAHLLDKKASGAVAAAIVYGD